MQLAWGGIWSETQLPQNIPVSVSNLLRRQSAPKHIWFVRHSAQELFWFETFLICFFFLGFLFFFETDQREQINDSSKKYLVQNQLSWVF